MARAVVDTGVIIEFIDLEGPLHRQAGILFSAALSGVLELIVPHPVLAETYYVAARIYSRLGHIKPEETASKLVEWLYRLPTAKVEQGVDLAIEAGRVKKAYKIALTDCYVLAASKIHKCTATFRKPEKEMLPHIDSLKREFKILFLESYR